MARRQPRPPADRTQTLEPLATCWGCGRRMWVAYHRHRRVVHLDGVCAYTLVVRRCRNRACAAYQVSVGPEMEGRLALPQGEVGLEVIALVGRLRFGEHRSVPEIHRELAGRGVRLAQRTVTNLLYRYEELLALRLGDPGRLRGRLGRQPGAVLAIDGLQPDVGHEVLWVLREVRSGEVLLARSLLGAREEDLPAAKSPYAAFYAVIAHDPILPGLAHTASGWITVSSGPVQLH